MFPAELHQRVALGRLRSVGGLVLALAVLGLVACDPPGPTVSTVIDRWIVEAEVPVLVPDQLRDTVETHAWADGDAAALLTGGLTVDLDTLGVDLVEMVLEPPPGFPILAWGRRPGEDSLGEGDPGGPTRGRIHGSPVAGQPGTYRFVLGDHPHWTGRASSFEIEPPSLAGVATAVRDLRLLRWDLDREELSAAVSTPRKIDLGNQVREGWLAPPGVPRTWTPRPESLGHSTLEIAYGLLKGVRQTVVFRIVDTASDAQLFEATLSPAESGVWHRASVDLGSWQGPTLRFETATQDPGAEPINLARGLPAWGTPVLTTATASNFLPTNILVLSIDTLRADRLELYGHTRQTAPHLTAWAQEHAVVFEQAIAPSPWTLPSHVSLFTGQNALGHGVNFNRPAPGSLVTLAERLKDMGYWTEAVTGGGYLNPSFGLTQGFESFRYWSAAQGEIESGAEHFLAALENPPEPFFLFFHTYEVHSPFYARQPHFEALGGDPELDPAALIDIDNPPMGENPYFHQHKGLARVDAQGARSPLEPEGLDELGLRYDSGIARVDALLAPLWEKLEASGLAERTLVILTSDHGEALGEKGLGGHAYLYDFNLRIPLVVGFPGGRHGGERVERQVRLVDVAPTVIDEAGADPLVGIDGVPLQTLFDGRAEAFPQEAWSYAASSNYGIALRLGNRSKYILNDTAAAPALGRAELYHLGDDPAEEHELLAAGREDGERLRQRVEETLRRRARGLELTWTAPAEGPLSGHVRGAAMQVMKLKSWRSGCDTCFVWTPGRVAVEVPAGGVAQLMVLDPGPAGRLALELSDAAGTTWTGHLDLANLGDGGRVVLDGDTWTPTTDPVLDSQPSLRWRWVGGETGTAEDVTHDPELERQLEALGYLDAG